MKNYLLLSLICSSVISLSAQEKKSVSRENDSINKWTFEINAGQSKGVKPYSTGYFSSNPEAVFGSVRINYYNIGARYMFSPKFGIKLDFGFDKMTNNPKSSSLPFQTNQYRTSIQGVINASRLFNIEENLNRLGLLIHGGLQISNLTPKIENPQPGATLNKTEYDGGLIFGVSPQYRISRKLAIVGDVSITNNFRQHFTWDGAYSEDNNNLSGQLVSLTLGLSYSIGNKRLHGDWAVVPDKNLVDLEPLEKRVGEIETLMNDTDKDGVPDYLDQENNSLAGVTVDTKGRMVDANKNGVPDELEKYLQNNYANKDAVNAANTDLVKKFINEGYVTAYYDTNKSTPTNVSTEGIDFILTYLRNNPSASVDIFGHADEVGKSESNANLSKKRAENVKATLVQAGINPSRLFIIPSGEDTSVDVNSEVARKLVRRVTFKVK